MLNKIFLWFDYAFAFRCFFFDYDWQMEFEFIDPSAWVHLIMVRMIGQKKENELFMKFNSETYLEYWKEISFDIICYAISFRAARIK